ncbi:endonuclease domain-containing protein [Brevundimonas diminuta]|uniref:endonuclease domain-containing protein n=1 Tax=Brevundimonas diminuta TaxID=293 RepID=UPI00211AFFDF|nr:endonuclease domain-containing protein [Brevundimonas diminuta]WQE45529.1 endonuclease domain-containing protein [Brevundimonas diminuta]
MEKPSARNRVFARRSRRAPTDAESAIWTLLKDRRLHGVKFRRQVLIGPYVADFACHALKLGRSRWRDSSADRGARRRP